MPSLSSIRRSSFRKRQRRKIIFSVIAIPVAFGLVVFGLAYFLRSPFMTISKVRVIGNAVISNTDLESAVYKAISGNYLKVLPKTNAFIYPKSDVKKNILNDFKRIESVDIKRDNLKTLSVTITERMPEALWCASDTNNGAVHFSDACYFIDPHGYIFAESPEFSPTALLRFYGSVKGNPVGSTYFSKDMFRSLVNFAKNVEMLSLKPLRIYSNAEGDFELYLEKGGKIIFARDADMTKIFGNLQTLLTDQQEKLKNGSKLTVDYIDLRFGNKIYYK